MKKSFNEKCYSVLKKVPKGKVTTYKEIARAVGTRAYRAVGNAMNKNPYAPQIPCHRVVKSDGKVGGFAERSRRRRKNKLSITRARSGDSGEKKKIQLLKNEGIEIKNNKIDLKKYFYKL